MNGRAAFWTQYPDEPPELRYGRCALCVALGSGQQ
jgi:hypothetical protein